MQWVCDICGYVHDEDELPEACPVCGAPKSRFSEWDDDDDPIIKKDDDEDIDYFERDLYGDIEE